MRRCFRRSADGNRVFQSVALSLLSRTKVQAPRRDATRRDAPLSRKSVATSYERGRPPSRCRRPFIYTFHAVTDVREDDFTNSGLTLLSLSLSSFLCSLCARETSEKIFRILNFYIYIEKCHSFLYIVIHIYSSRIFDYTFGNFD